MKASAFEFRYRIWISTALYVLGFWAPWLRYGAHAGTVTTAWLELSGELGRVMSLQAATIAVTTAAIVLLAAGAAFHVWGTAYIGTTVMRSANMHAQGVLAAGPYRYLRNPLYLGSWLTALGIAILMPPSGAILAAVGIFVQVLRLILREEPYLSAQQGEAYLAYKRQVPRLIPSITPRVPAQAARPRWGQALAAETFPIAATLCFAALAWRYNASLLMRAVLISFGVSLVVRAFLSGDRGEVKSGKTAAQ